MPITKKENFKMRKKQVELFDQVINAHRAYKKKEIEFKALAEAVKDIMADKKISVWENSKGSITIKKGPRKVFNKEALEKTGISYDTFCDIKMRESFNVSHK